MPEHQHPVNRAMHEDASFGERAAEGMATAIGSWRFIIIQTILVALWISYNAWVAFNYLHTGDFDPFPFVLLNLMFSVQAAYTGPILLIAANRSGKRDRLTLEHDHEMLGILRQVLEENTKLTQEIHEHICKK